jgi:lipopolysaccharide biosynthesis regulator YciM
VTGKRAIGGLILVLLAFGYVFTLNPGMVEFQIYPGAKVSTSLALVLFLFALAGFCAALLVAAFKEAARSFLFWRHRKGEQRKEEGKRLLLEGRGQMVLGKTRAARRLLERAHRKTGGELLVALEVARVELAEGRAERAAGVLRQLQEREPDNPEILSLLLEAYRRKGDFEGQVTTLRRRLEREPEHLASHTALRELYEKSGNWGEAARVQEHLASRSQSRDDRNRARRRLAELRLLQAGTLAPAQARPLLERVVREHTDFAPAFAALGEARHAEGNAEGAADAWLRGFQATDQPALLLKLEQLRLEQGRAADMLKLYKKLGRKGGAAVLLHARLLLQLERAQEALEVLERAEAPLRGSRAARNLLGESLFRLRSYDEAARAFRDGAAGQRGDLLLEYTCSRCRGRTTTWGSRCPHCERFDSLQIDLEATSARAALPAPA